MIGRSIALYVHILGAITLFVAAGLVQLGVVWLMVNKPGG